MKDASFSSSLTTAIVTIYISLEKEKEETEGDKVVVYRGE